MKVTWGDIGSSDKPGEYRVDDQIILVQKCDIAEWKRHPDAEFDVIDARFKDGGIGHLLDESASTGVDL